MLWWKLKLVHFQRVILAVLVFGILKMFIRPNCWPSEPIDKIVGQIFIYKAIQHSLETMPVFNNKTLVTYIMICWPDKIKIVLKSMCKWRNNHSIILVKKTSYKMDGYRSGYTPILLRTYIHRKKKMGTTKPKF